ncbi:hypothetical protein ZWY2020_041392 [Hordeum vulgare]|nr:hypothetical protein ZWY2020_041392 [Hordeum vulgare]
MRRSRTASTSMSAVLVADSPRATSASVMTAAAPRTFIDRHTARSFAQPPTSTATAGSPPAWRTTSKPTKLMIPNVGTNPPAQMTRDRGRRRKHQWTQDFPAGARTPPWAHEHPNPFFLYSQATSRLTFTTEEYNGFYRPGTHTH